MTPSSKKIRYGVIGLGYISQVAVLPAFKNADNSELVALFSNDPIKLKELGRKYDVAKLHSYEEFESVLKRGGIDAIYIAVPNHLHSRYTEIAAENGVHVLCEKPMAVRSGECESMIATAHAKNVKLMIAYRLHFDEANLKAIDLIQKGKIGNPLIFNSVFTMNVKPQNIRRNPRYLGGGPIYDIGTYCINAARYIFRAEPTEVFATSLGTDDTIAAALRFDNERVATFTICADSAPSSFYQVVGTKGDLRVENAYDYVNKITHRLTIGDHVEHHTFQKHDQFAPELIYFSECILKNKEPEPSGLEGLADVRIIEAILRSVDSREIVAVRSPEISKRPDMSQKIIRPSVREPKLIHAEDPSSKVA
jgi:glucose-fructose oxidoreductase